jgi:peptidyl-prolyl cis-trans isomerase B (cyclophilin B)
MLKIGILLLFTTFAWAAEDAPASAASIKNSVKSEKPVKEKHVKNPVVEIKTTKGLIVVELDKEKAPKSVENFLMYVKDKFYDDTVFHRVIDNFMIQGGGFKEDMSEKDTKDPIKNEADNGLKNDKYTIAMARTSDPHSASAQFYINVKDNGALNFREKTAGGWGYAVFGKVTKGQDVVDKIKGVKTGVKNTPGGIPMDDVPVEMVKIESIRLKK